MNNFDSSYCYLFPAVRGIQAGRPFYITTCPLRIVPKIFGFDSNNVSPDLRAQRSLNRSRIPKMVRYLLDNPKDYIFPAITASIDINVEFDEYINFTNVGVLKVPMNTKILINDGQHRRKAIEKAIGKRCELGQDNIPVLFFVDEGLKRSQQIFADLNRHAVKPSPSLSILYDHRNKNFNLTRYLAASIKPFLGLTEMEKSTITVKSDKLFTLNSIKQATRALLAKKEKNSYSESEIIFVREYWQTVYLNMPDWKMAIQKKITAPLLRQKYIHSHDIGLYAIGMLGNSLVKNKPETWREELIKLRNIDWRKSNFEWTKRKTFDGKLNKSMIAMQLTYNALKKSFHLPLTPEEKLWEEQVISK